MRRILSFIMVLSLLFASCISTVSASSQDIKVTIDGELVQFDVKPIIESGRTLVPFRAIFEKLGASVDWDEATSGVTATKGDITINLFLNNKTGLVNGVAHTLDVPAKAVSGRTLVPLRFVLESMGLEVVWVEATKDIIITSPVAVVPEPVVPDPVVPDPVVPDPIIIGARTEAPVQDASQIGGTDLAFAFVNGSVTVSGDFMAIPSVASPGSVKTDIYFGDKEPSAKWIGLSIPAPTSEVPTSGKVSITIEETGRPQATFKNVDYSPEAPLQYYLAALAPGRSVTLDLVWGGAYAETLVVEYEDTTVRPLDNLFIHKAADFTGSHDNTRLVTAGGGAVELMATNGKYPAQGTYTSDFVPTQPFEYMVMSWNADTPKGTHVEVEARAVRADGVLTEWLSWGRWGTHMESGNIAEIRTYSRMNSDILTIRGSQREDAVAVQYRVNLVSANPAVTPTVRLVAGTLRNTLSGKTIPKAYDLSAVNPNLQVDLDVPSYSQYIRDPQFASAICSPTSLAMVMEYHGVAVLVEEVSKAAYDKNLGAEGGYGNWSFNAAVAGSQGFESYVDYFGVTNEDTLNLIRLELAKGNPIIASVRYKNSASVAANWPVLDGAPISSTSGHLVVIRGIMEKDGVTYLIVNDSAARTDEDVRHEYRADQFLQAWHQRVAYIVRPGGGGGHSVPAHIASTFEPTGETREVSGIAQTEFVLKDGAGNVISLNHSGRSRYISITYRKGDGPVQYIAPPRSQGIWFNNAKVEEGYTFTIFFTGGRTYVVTLQ